MFLMDGLNFNQGNGETTLSGRHAWRGDHLVLTGRGAIPKVWLEGGLQLLPWHMRGSSSMNLA